MIKVNNINGFPESKPEGEFVAVTNDNDFFYYFSTKDELQAYRDSLPKHVEAPQKIDLSNIDIDSLTDDQILKLKQRIGL